MTRAAEPQVSEGVHFMKGRVLTPQVCARVMRVLPGPVQAGC